MSAQGRSGWPALVASTACWGSVVVLIRIASRGVPVQTISLLEVVGAILVLGAVVLLGRVRLRRPPPILVLAGLLEPGLAYPIINAGLARTSGAHGAIILGTESVWIVLVGALLARKAPSRLVWVALAVTSVGAGVVGLQEGGDASLGGDVLVAVGIMCAAGYVLAAQYVVELDAVAMTFWQFLCGGVVVLPIATIAAARSSDGWWGHPTGGQAAAALATGVVGSAAAFWLYNFALGRVGTTAAGIGLTLIPVFGVLFSAVLLGEPVTALTLLAGVAVVVGVALLAAQPAAHPSPG